jgi:hypothetical protein
MKLQCYISPLLLLQYYINLLNGLRTCSMNGHIFVYCHKVFGWSNRRDTGSLCQLFTCLCRLGVWSTNSWANRSQTESIQITAGARNPVCFYAFILGTSQKVYIHALQFLFRNKANLELKPETLKPSLLCKMSKRFLKEMFEPNANFILFLFNECFSRFWLSFSYPVKTLPDSIYL